MKMPIKTQAIAPGKLILCGEHAVVYGHPALAMAVNRYVTTTVVPQSESKVSFYFPDFLIEQSLTFDELKQLHDRLMRNYQCFLRRELAIQEVMQGPIELVQFALSVLLDTVTAELVEGFQIHMRTDIPIGCGMGSSAAAILSILTAISHHFQMAVTPELLFSWAQQTENMQHGQSSGLDLKSSLHGGCLYFKEGQMMMRALPKLPFYLINTGQPQTSTGECIAVTADFFKATQIGEEFAAVTDAMDQALHYNNMDAVILAMRENHKLLNTIGVVPEKIQQLIEEIEQQGGGAKISGAGAVRGDNAGAVIITMKDEAVLKEIAERYHRVIIPIQCETRGVYLSD